MTLPGVKQWLSSRKKTYTPELSLSPSPLEGTALIHDYCQRLDDLFHRDKMAYNSFLACRGAAAQELLDLLQNLLDYDSNLSTPTRRRLCKALIRLSRDSKLHPGCFTLTGLEQGQHVAGGSFSDVHKALFEGQYVAVKMMRVFEGSDIEALLKEFGREALIWRQLCHPNLLPFFGLYYFQHRLCLVSPWMESGHIRAFLKKKTCDTGRLLSFILDVALGLEHLHEQGVVHGDLKGDNIFVTPSGRACIADFGLSSIITSESSVQMSKSSKPSQGGTTRYQAPELHRGGHNNLCSDIYSFACVAYEMLTGTAPFPELRTDGAVITAVLNGRRPPRPQWCSRSPSLEGLWNLLQSCWNEEPTMRPTAAELVQRLMGPDIQATKNQSATDWDERFTSRFRRHFLGEWYLPSFAELERIFGRQFTCDRCSKQFARMDALNRHLRSGDGVDCQRTLESDSSGDSAGRGHQRSCSMDSDSMGSDSMESDSMESDIIVWRATA
ncbi:kinase-like domain-containing protein [Mycena polygramma]|nr:kinase-like domain-containing protein [Mycena polygramma]